MKRIVLALALILSLGFSTTAQAFSFDWGITGGYSITKMKFDSNFDKYLDSDNRSGWFVGAKINLGLFMGFGLDGALMYSQQKINVNNYDADGYHNQYNSSETQRCLEIPINLKYSIGLGKTANIYLTTGPQFNVNIGDDNWYDDWGYNDDYGHSDRYYFEREHVTASWNVGGGIKLFSHFDVGVVYNFGISPFGEDVLEGLTHTNWHPSETKTNSFKVQVTYYF